jgi:hypothetical protein
LRHFWTEIPAGKIVPTMFWDLERTLLCRLHVTQGNNHWGCICCCTSDIKCSNYNLFTLKWHKYY